METTKQHIWTTVGEDGARCAKCDCRFGGRWHDLPCGTVDEELTSAISHGVIWDNDNF